MTDETRSGAQTRRCRSVVSDRAEASLSTTREISPADRMSGRSRSGCVAWMYRSDRFGCGELSFEALVGLAVSAPLALGAGVAMIAWRKNVAAWYARVFDSMPRGSGSPFAKASTPRAVVLVVCFFVLIGAVNAIRLLTGLVR